MPTTITKTIAQTSSPTVPDYTSMAAWLAACPASLVAADEIWDGQCLDQGKFTTQFSISGITTDATRYLVLECAAGASFSTKSGVRTTALAYNATTGNGVALEGTGGSGAMLVISNANTQVIGLQINTTGYSTCLSIGSGATNAVISDCIVRTAGTNSYVVADASNATGVVFKNCLIVSADHGAHTGSTWEFCTLIHTGAASTTVAFHSDYNNAVIKNCAAFGFFSFTDSTPAAGSDYNATDAATAVTGTHNQTSLTFASQFVSTTTDFRAVSTGSLKNGTPIVGITTDISLFTRDVTTPYIGAWEAAAPAISFTISPATIPASHVGNIALTATGTGTSWTNGSVVTVTNSLTGTTTVTKVSWSTSSATAGTLTISVGAGAGTYKVTIDGVDVTGTLTVGAAALAVSPTSGTVSTTPTITLTGTDTIWTHETAAGLFSVSGVAGCSIGTPTVTTDTAATAVLTLGSTAGTLTITDNSTGATTTFAVNLVSGGITVTAPAPWQTYQRNGSNQATITVTGTYTGGPTAKNMECSLAGSAFVALSTVPSAGTINGTVTFTVTPGTANVQGNFVIRFRDATGINTTVTDVGIGDVFVVAGQSNAVGLLDALQFYTHATLKATCFGTVAGNPAWKEGNDPFYSTSVLGSIWPLLATHHMNDQGVPCAFVQTAIGGRSLDNGTPFPYFFPKYNPTSGASGGGWTNMTTDISSSGVTSFKAVLWVQCENDIDNNVNTPPYVASQLRLAESLNADIAGAPPLVPCIRGYSSGGGSFAAIRPAIAEASYLSTFTLGPVSDIDMAVFGGVGGPNALHWQSQQDGNTVAARFWACLKSNLFGGTVAAGRGPRMTSCQYNGAQNAITVTFDQILKTGLTFDASVWAVTGNGTSATVTSVAYSPSDTRAVILSLSGAAALPILVSFGLVAATAGKVVPQGQDFTLPAGAGTINLPADPFANQPAAAETTTAGGGCFSPFGGGGQAMGL